MNNKNQNNLPDEGCTIMTIKKKLSENGVELNANILKKFLEASGYITLRSVGDTKNLAIDAITDFGQQNGIRLVTRQGKRGQYDAVVFPDETVTRIVDAITTVKTLY